MSNNNKNNSLHQLFAELDKVKNAAKAAKSPFYLKVEATVEAVKEEAKIAHRQEKDERSKLMIERREFEIKESEFSDSKYVGGRVSTQIYYKMTKNRDLFWDVCDRDQGRHHPSNWARHGVHGSKGQKKGKVDTKSYAKARAEKYFVDPGWYNVKYIPKDILLVNLYSYVNPDAEKLIFKDDRCNYYNADIKKIAYNTLKDKKDLRYQCEEIHIYTDDDCPVNILTQVIAAAKDLFKTVVLHTMVYNRYDYSEEEIIQTL